MDKERVRVHSISRNSNNSNNNSNKNPDTSYPVHSGSNDNEFDELGEIHPQMTPEGYGLRTPYGTHFNLDFLKYCQNFAGHDADSRSSSGRSSVNSFDSRSESTKYDSMHASESKVATESTLWETRRRLNAFRSFRRNKASPMDNRSYVKSNEYMTHSPGNSIANDLKVMDPESPTSRSSPLQQQQNLQAVREQMAAALNRLKYLENEAKQIPILQVKISVLQQERDKLAEQVKAYQEKTPSKEEKVKVTASAIPPPPPRRKYKSVGVSTECTPVKLSLSEISIEEYIPESGLQVHDFAVQVNPPMVERLDQFTQTNKFSGVDKSTAFSPKSSDFCTNVYIPGISIASQATCEYVDCGSATESVKTCDRAMATEVLNIDKSFQFRPIVSDFSCHAVVHSGTDTYTSTDSVYCKEAFSNTDCVTSCDFSVQHNPDMHDEGVHVCSSTCDTAVSVNITVEHQDAAVQFGPVHNENASINSCFSAKSMQMQDFAVHVRPDTIDAIFQVDVEKVSTSTSMDSVSLVDSCSNTDMIESVDFCSQILPSTCSVGLNAVTLSDDISTQFSPTTADACVDSKPAYGNFSVQVQPEMKDKIIDNSAEMIDASIEAKFEIAKAETMDRVIDNSPKMTDVSIEAKLDIARLKTMDKAVDNSIKMVNVSSEAKFEITRPKSLHSSTQTSNAEKSGNDKDSCQTCDAATDTSDLSYVPFGDNEIGTYVGQVESLLDEQQSLLANQYKELGAVLDNSSPADADLQKDERSYDIELSKEIDIISVRKRYSLPRKSRDACEVIALGLRSGNSYDVIPWADALQILKEEWFFISANKDANPDNIKDFATEVRSIAADILSQVINSLDETGNSSLHYAVSNANFDAICALVDIPEFNVNQYNKAGYTATMLAAITQIRSDLDSLAVAKLFQRADVCLHAKQAGQTALMLAVSHGCISTARLLLDAGADVNAQDEDGSTALMCATEHGHIELVKILLASPECDPTIADSDGSTAINIAMDSGQRDIGVLLYVHLNLDKSNDS